MEAMEIVGKSKEDVSLPKATMCKIIKEMLPPDVRVARDTQDLLVECCVEFINLISSESNEVCNREDRRTIAPDHVLKALEVLGFGDYIEEVYAAFEQHKLDTMDSPKAGKYCITEMTEEQALAEQQRMFAEARARMNNGISLQKQSDSEEQAPAEQQRMFAEARARMNNEISLQKQSDSEEQAPAEQQRMFAEARARMNNGISLQKQSDSDHALDGSCEALQAV